MSSEKVPYQYMQFFEGVEKLLEIWFTNPKEESADLRNIPRSYWETLLKAVKCEIISCSQNETIDAYVLSESSMFISKRKWILKTCGTTTLLHCLKPLLNIASQYGFNTVCDLFYSRKNFSRPELQLFPHRGFCEEVEFLDSIFPDGRSYCLGSINRDCWYLYTFSKNKKYSYIPLEEGNERSSEQTIEILMQNLDSTVMSSFSKDSCLSAKQATLKSGIHKILPNMTIDDYLFDPCGYSMNGIRNNGEYMTIHVTPEKHFSYVSFESNVGLENYADLISNVIKIFLPSKFMVTIFTNKASGAYSPIEHLEVNNNKNVNWKCTDMQYCNFSSYNLLFAQYSQYSKS